MFHYKVCGSKWPQQTKKWLLSMCVTKTPGGQPEAYFQLLAAPTGRRHGTMLGQIHEPGDRPGRGGERDCHVTCANQGALTWEKFLLNPPTVTE